MATIRRVTIHRLRNVKPGCTFELHPGLNVLLGQNGTGKTTLLQWMADFMSGNLESWSKEPYRVEVEMEAAAKSEIARLRVKLDNDISEPSQDQDQRKLGFFASLFGQSVNPGLLTANITIDIGTDSYEIERQASHRSFRVNDDLLVESDTVGQPAPMLATMLLEVAQGLVSRLSNVANDVDKEKGSIALRAMERVLPIVTDLLWLPLRFDESLGFFHRIVTGLESQARVTLTQHGQVKLQQIVSDELVELISGKLRQTDSDLQTITFTSADIKGFLNTSVRLFQYHSADVHLTLLTKDVRDGEPILTYGNLRFTFHRHDGSIIGHDALSYGQKRMLSFLYYLALYPRLIIVDELVNGLHHAWIEACINEIGDRQGILTSQNPLLLDYLTFDSADEVRQRFILCRSERENGREQLVWRNPNQEEAESFFRAYQAGIQHVGEILVDKGLW